MPVGTMFIDGDAPAPVQAPAPTPPPASTPAPPPPPPPVDVAAATTAGVAAGAAVTAILAGGGAAEASAAAAAAGATPDVVSALASSNIPSLAGLTVTSTSPPPVLPAVTPDLGATPEQIAAANAAALYTTAAMNALLAGGSADEIADAAAPAGAPQDVVDNLRSMYASLPDGAGGAALAPWELEDPFGVRGLAGNAGPLRGAEWVASMLDWAGVYHLDPKAVGADALGEGPGGTIGDGGLAYGPFQDHLTEFRGRPFYGRGKNNQTVNGWAWSSNGTQYSLRQMAIGPPMAFGLTGHAAVEAIVRGYERPEDIPAAIRTRNGYYDLLTSHGDHWAVYLASRMLGPASAKGQLPTPAQVGGTSGDTAPVLSPKPSKQWKATLHFFANDVPACGASARAAGNRARNAVRSQVWSAPTG